MVLFLSDTHLGNKHCKSKELLSFLENYHPKTELVAVGDIIDDHQTIPWEPDHIRILNEILKFRKITYLPGNHDIKFARLASNRIRTVEIDITITRELLYRIGDKVFYIVHGDQYDWLIKFTLFMSESWIAKKSRIFFSYFHDWVVTDNSFFEERVANAAKKVKADGVICGHTHLPCRKIINDIEYINIGDWMDSCTALEYKDGEFRHITLDTMQLENESS
jgi:UDP-2,3-diacylglucosamine pyrophosphatase LpxH